MPITASPLAKSTPAARAGPFSRAQREASHPGGGEPAARLVGRHSPCSSAIAVSQRSSARSMTPRLADGRHLKLRPDNLAYRTADIEPGNPIFDLAVDALERINAIATSQGTDVLVVTYAAYLSAEKGARIDIRPYLKA